MEKLKFGDPESIQFVKKWLAGEWLQKHKADILTEFYDLREMPQCDNNKFDIVIKKALDSYFWFDVWCEEDNWFDTGTIFLWKNKKWYFKQGYQTPKVKQTKDQLSFA